MLNLLTIPGENLTLDTLVSPVVPQVPLSTLAQRRGRRKSPVSSRRGVIEGVSQIVVSYTDNISDYMLSVALLTLCGSSSIVHFHLLQRHLPRPHCYKCHKVWGRLPVGKHPAAMGHSAHLHFSALVHHSAPRPLSLSSEVQGSISFWLSPMP